MLRSGSRPAAAAIPALRRKAAPASAMGEGGAGARPGRRISRHASSARAARAARRNRWTLGATWGKRKEPCTTTGRRSGTARRTTAPRNGLIGGAGRGAAALEVPVALQDVADLELGLPARRLRVAED